MLMGMVLSSTALLAQPVLEDETQKETVPVSVEKVENEAHAKGHIRQKHKNNFIERLNLTEEQKQKAKELREKNKPQMEELFAKMRELRKQAEEIRKQNKEEFESILTPEQKEILQKMKQEHLEKIKLKKHKK